jgi:ribonucleoside-diphosphate reductase alpha chain
MADLAAKGDLLYIDMIEDRIERELMSEKYFDVAKSYILYRAEKTKNQGTASALIDESAPIRQFEIITTDNGKLILTDLMLKSKLAYACRGLEPLVNVDELLETVVAQYYIGMKEQEVDLANIFPRRLAAAARRIVSRNNGSSRF